MSMHPNLPRWESTEETPDDMHHMSRYKVYPCAGYVDGDCCSRSCFDYHAESEMRRPVVDGTGKLLYWDALCPFVEKGQLCPYNYNCTFAHTDDERQCHPGQYKAAERPQASQYSLRGNVGVACGDDSTSASSSVYKRRFCAHYPKVDNCRRKEFCMFAHSREEIRAPLLTEQEEAKNDLSNSFFIHKFKIFWCPIGVQHDWQTCVYAHNYQDARRNPAIGYGPRPCPFWEKKDRAPSYEARCPNGFRCPYSHGAKEQLYHPRYFKSVVCWDFDQNCSGCPRDNLCAFYHRKKTQRQAGKDVTTYTKPLAPAQMRKLQPFFRAPPFFADEPDARGRRKRDSPPRMMPMQMPMPMMMGMDCPMMYNDCSPMSQGSPSHGGTPMMMMGDPNQMPMMMYLPQSPNNFMMPCDPSFSPAMRPMQLTNKGEESPTDASTHPGSPSPFGSPNSQVEPFQQPFGGLFTMPVDTIGENANLSSGMMMMPMFLEPCFEQPQAELKQASVLTQATASGSGTDPSEGSDGDSLSAAPPAYHSQYLWTEADAAETPPVTA